MGFKSSAKILHDLKRNIGLFVAAPSDKTGYNKFWLRDNIYASLGLEIINPGSVVSLTHKLFDILIKHEYKIDWAIREKPKHAYQYIHARYNPDTLEEYWEEWGNKQNDAVGAFLFRVADLLDKGYYVVRDDRDWRIIKKLIAYLASIQYWHDPDNGMWEEIEEVHASSIGACLAGLKKISKYTPVPEYLIAHGEKALHKLLPRESEIKETDLALLSLIYPYNLLDENMTKEILHKVETKLLRTRGLIRYVGDWYYNSGGEAEWTMGFPWLAIIYRQLGNKNKYAHYMKKTFECLNDKGELPELYYSNSDQHNENSPLGWAQSLYLVAAN